MFESINEVAVVGCTLLMLAVYTLWYAFFYSKLPQKYSEFTELLLAGACCVCMVGAVSYAQSVFNSVGVSPWVFATVLALFSCALVGAVSVKEGKDLRGYLVHAGFAVLFCFGSVFLLYYWPW